MAAHRRLETQTLRVWRRRRAVDVDVLDPVSDPRPWQTRCRSETGFVQRNQNLRKERTCCKISLIRIRLI